MTDNSLLRTLIPRDVKDWKGSFWFRLGVVPVLARGAEAVGGRRTEEQPRQLRQLRQTALSTFGCCLGSVHSNAALAQCTSVQSKKGVNASNESPQARGKPRVKLRGAAVLLIGTLQPAGRWLLLRTD
jgi:hypothetical protein